jgi:hypothetical protein
VEVGDHPKHLRLGPGGGAGTCRSPQKKPPIRRLTTGVKPKPALNRKKIPGGTPRVLYPPPMPLFIFFKEEILLFCFSLPLCTAREATYRARTYAPTEDVHELARAASCCLRISWRHLSIQYPAGAPRPVSEKCLSHKGLFKFYTQPPPKTTECNRQGQAARHQQLVMLTRRERDDQMQATLTLLQAGRRLLVPRALPRSFDPRSSKIVAHSRLNASEKPA